MKRHFCEDCPYFYNGTYRGHCEQIITMCDRWAREKKDKEQNKKSKS